MLIYLLLLSLPIISFGQEGSIDLLTADTTWGQEVFPFPIGFAQEIDYEGVEDVRFPPAWGKQDSDEFWSYVFVWSIDLDEDITEQELERDLQIYFNGLMSGRAGKDRDSITQNTLALFLEEEGSDDRSTFKGKINMFEGFYTKKPITLQVQVEQYRCVPEKKSFILFRFSPQAFDHAVWRKLAAVKLRADVCGD